MMVRDRRLARPPAVHKPVTVAEKALHNAWMKEVMENGLFTIESARLRQELGCLVAKREAWEKGRALRVERDA